MHKSMIDAFIYHRTIIRNAQFFLMFAALTWNKKSILARYFVAKLMNKKKWLLIDFQYSAAYILSWRSEIQWNEENNNKIIYIAIWICYFVRKILMNEICNGEARASHTHAHANCMTMWIKFEWNILSHGILSSQKSNVFKFNGRHTHTGRTEHTKNWFHSRNSVASNAREHRSR